MKKQLLSILATFSIASAIAQTPSPSWTITQNPSFTVPIAGTRYIDAVDQNVVWLSGFDGNFPGRNYNWYSRTVNGGTSYNSGSIFPDTNTYVLANMEGIDANTAWVAAFRKVGQNQGGIFRTTNGGTTWTNMSAPGMFTNTASFANFVTFLTPSVGIANGDPTGLPLVYELWTTADGGTSWTKVPAANIPAPLAGEYAITNLYCKDGSSHVWFGTNRGRVFRTSDAGQTWSASAIQTGVVTNTVLDVSFAGPLNGLALVVNGTTADLYNSIDGGVTWNNVGTPGTLPLNFGANEISSIPGTTYFASVSNNGGTGFLSYSVDNGVTWTDWGGTGLTYLTIDFVNSNLGWTGGFQGLNGASGIWKYNGVTFNSIFTLPINICKPNNTVLVTPVNNSAGFAPLTFSWSAQPAGAVFSSATASVPVITFSANGTYTVSLRVTDVNGLPSTSSQIINVLSCGSPTASFNIPSTVCNNSAFTLTNTSTGVPIPTYTISTSATSGVTVTPVPSTQFVTVRFSAPGVYSITSNVSSISGTSALTRTINVLNCAPVADFRLYIPATDASSLTPATSATGCVDGGTAALARITATNITTGSNGVINYTWTTTPPPSHTLVSTYTVQGGNLLKNFIVSQFPGTFTVTLLASNISGTSSVTKTFDVNLCVGVVDNSLADNLSVYPNPAHEQINIVLPVNAGACKIKMVNVLGAVVYEEKVVKDSKDSVAIKLANKDKGIYFLIVEANNEKVVKKIVVE
jgi:photosystem II stability/assembly factor-like uncharacterized protein